jgi:hypothetical protein
MNSVCLPTPTVNVARFCRKLEQQLEADYEAYKCCVCYDPLANVPLKCPHRLCPDCFEKLDTCPLCRTRFREDELVFANFDACIWRRSCHPRNYDIHLYGGELRDHKALAGRFVEASWTKGVDYHMFTEDQNTTLLGWADLKIARQIIYAHTRSLNTSSKNIVRREMVRQGWLKNDAYSKFSA